MSTPERPTVPGDEREQRWTLEPRRGLDGWTQAIGPIPAESVEVVPASRLAEAEAERDGYQSMHATALEQLSDVEAARDRAVAAYNRLDADYRVARASLDCAREALTRIAGWSRTGFCAETAQAALAALPVVERTEAPGGC